MALTVADAPLFMSRLNRRSVHVRFVLHEVALVQYSGFPCHYHSTISPYR